MDRLKNPEATAGLTEMAAGCMTAALPWQNAQALAGSVDLGPGLETAKLQEGMERLCSLPGVQAVIAFGSRGRGEARSESDLDLAVICAEDRLTPKQKRERWRLCRKVLGLVGSDVDLMVMVMGWADAAYLAESRWHVMGDVAREGRVLYAAG